jgi:hypothetical protein
MKDEPTPLSKITRVTALDEHALSRPPPAQIESRPRRVDSRVLAKRSIHR